MTDKSARQRILDTTTGRERISDDFIPLVRARDLSDLLREHEAQEKAIREALTALGDVTEQWKPLVIADILSSVLEQTPVPNAPTDPTQPLEDVGNVPTGEQTPEPPEPAVVQRVADSAWAVMRERGIEPRFENESDGVLDPDGVFLAIGEQLVSRTDLPIDSQIGHGQTPEGSGR